MRRRFLPLPSRGTGTVKAARRTAQLVESLRYDLPGMDVALAALEGPPCSRVRLADEVLARVGLTGWKRKLAPLLRAA